MPVASLMKGNSGMDRKIVSISSKRQITIPLKYFKALGFTEEAECLFRGNEIVIRPVRIATGGEFAEQILTDLVAQGLSGEELLTEFKRRQAQIRPAVEAMIGDAENVAQGKGEYATYEDVFGEEEE